ncbi:hypothetical protein GCM10027405_02610 [Arthrobacter alkaliphilus]|uniref:hypothetical protein n=1 Tax=Arthrobacter alkaliphilus TaxID=369936 RepID=UPI001F3115FE|nr:hypothetical protein [Arthrobacter alkaliphilus]
MSWWISRAGNGDYARRALRQALGLTPGLISGSVFVISGARVDRVVNTGPVTTSGQNDMVLDNWGTVKTWTADAPTTSNVPGGIGFVSFGDIDSLEVKNTIRTTGKAPVDSPCTTDLRGRQPSPPSDH